MKTLLSNSDGKYIGLLIAILTSISVYTPLTATTGSTQDTTRIPPGQRPVDNFPILHIAEIPDLNHENWSLTITGKVERPVTLKWNDLMNMDTVRVVSNFHCVTGWSRLDNHWTGVLFRTLFKKIGIQKNARYVTFKGADSYFVSLPLADCTGEQDMLAFRWEGILLDKSIGGPVRAVIPSKYGYKSTMWLTEIEITVEEYTGYWEERGYHKNANPWKEERFSQ